MSCLFCEIAAGNVGSTKVFENERILAFKDIHPMAPFHVLIIPKEHIGSAAEITAENSKIVSEIFEVAAKLAAENNLVNGFRIITNYGKDAGQTVGHLHFHLLGGRELSLSLG